MFGDYAFVGDRVTEQESSYEDWLSNIQRPIVIEIGAGATITSVFEFSRRMDN